MNYTEALAAASRFIEERLGEEVTLESTARAAGISAYHFHRIFKAVVGESPSAFRGRGIISYMNQRPPADAKTFAHLGDGLVREPQIAARKGGTFVGLEISGNIGERDILGLWDELQEDLPRAEFEADTAEAFGICDYTERYDLRKAACSETFTYFAGFKCADAPHARHATQDDGRFVYRSLDDRKYAIFEHAAPLELIERSYQYIYGTWLFHSGIELAKAPEVQYFGTEYLMRPDKPRLEIWVPVA